MGMISFKYQTIFVRIPRTASRAIGSMNRSQCGASGIYGLNGHATLAEIRNHISRYIENLGSNFLFDVRGVDYG